MANFFKDVGRGLEKTVSWIPHTTAAEKRATMGAAKEQMDFYHQQKEELHKVADDVSKQKMAEHQKINEKQIRALRRNYRSPGFMESNAAGVSEKLG